MGQAQTIYSYGVSSNMTARVEGVDTFKGGSNLGFYSDYDSLEEVNVRAMGGDADEATPGMNVQAIIRSGGNNFHGSGKFAGEDERFEPSGGAANNHQVYFWDVQGDVGGRILRDKWWFYSGVHQSKRKPTVLGYIGPAGGRSRR